MPRISQRVPIILAIMAGCVAFPGCVVGPAYHRPMVAVPDAFKESPPAGWKQAEPQEGVPRGEWWAIYQDSQLNALETQVSISNQNVLGALARYREARDQARIARASQLPSVTAAVSITTVRPPPSVARPNTINTAIGNNVDYALPVDISYQADVWGSIRRSVAAGALTAQASAADLENARLTYQSQLAVLYFELQGLDGDADLLQTTLALYQQSVELTQDRFYAGVSSEADVAQAETQLDTTRAELIDVGVARAQFEHAIATLVGKPPAEVSIREEALRASPPPIPVGVPSALLERRPDIAATERTVAAANEQIGIAKAALFPSLTLAAAGGLESASAIAWFSLPSLFWSAGPQLAATLFDGGKRQAQKDLQEAAYEETVAQYRQTVLTAFQQVEDELAALRILEQEAGAQDDAVRSAQQTLDIVTEQYRAGTTDYLQVISAQTIALQNQRTALDILARRLTSSVLLVEALGGGWDASQLPAH